MKHAIPTAALQNDDVFLDFLSAATRSTSSAQGNTIHPTASHPTPEVLYNYVLGWLAEAEANRVRLHLGGCGPCAREALHVMQIEAELEREAVAWADQSIPVETTISTPAAEMKTIVETLGEGVLRWISDFWEPQWAGQLVTAADIPAQTHLFTSAYGEIEFSCDWHDHSPHEPAALHVIWKAHFTCEQTLWLRMIEPETGWRYYEVCLGNRWVGEEYFTSAELGFNPVEQRWALAVLLSDASV